MTDTTFDAAAATDALLARSAALPSDRVLTFAALWAAERGRPDDEVRAIYHVALDRGRDAQPRDPIFVILGTFRALMVERGLMVSRTSGEEVG